MFGRQLYVLPVISEFIARYPLIRVRLLLSDRNADGERPCRSGGADWRPGGQQHGWPPASAPCGLWPAPIRRCWQYGEPQHGRADLAALPIITVNRRCPYRGWRFRAAEREDQLINLPPVLSVTTPEAPPMPRLGVGGGRLLHYQALDGLRHGNSVCCWKTSSPDPAPVHCCIPLGIWRRLSCIYRIFAAPAPRQALRIAGAANASRSSAAPPLTAM